MNYTNYYTEIEEAFIRRRGKNLLLSPLDWSLIESWQEREIPLHIVLRGIEKVFDSYDTQPNRRRSIKSIAYCKEEIEAQYAEWAETQVGVTSRDAEPERTPAANASDEDAEDAPESVLAAHLEQVRTQLQKAAARENGAMREALETAADRARRLQNERRDEQSIENELEKLDAFIDENLIKHRADENFKKETEKNLAVYKQKMSAEVYRSTFDLMLVKRLRETTHIPRAGLFNL